MFCTNCGNQLEDEAKFCSNCGQKVFTDISESMQVSSQESKDAFKMQVTDVFTITNRGIVVTGRIELGILKINDKVIIYGANGKQKEASISAIELDRKLVERAGKGETVGILFDCNITNTDVVKGNYIVK